MSSRFHPPVVFQFLDPHLEADHTPEPYDLLLGAGAIFRISVGRRVLYEEVDLPIIELALALSTWIETGFALRQAFEYVSMEADEPGFVWLRSVATGWRIGSIHQLFSDPTIRSDEEVRMVIGGFAGEVAGWLSRELGRDLNELRSAHQ